MKKSKRILIKAVGILAVFLIISIFAKGKIDLINKAEELYRSTDQKSYWIQARLYNADIELMILLAAVLSLLIHYGVDIAFKYDRRVLKKNLICIGGIAAFSAMILLTLFFLKDRPFVYEYALIIVGICVFVIGIGSLLFITEINENRDISDKPKSVSDK
jgi:hypothetical protein